MRILAVIPACEGSVSFPNKNIRVIHGKPLIYYTIYNALQSKYITDTIVTTNSNEVITIAKQMGVQWRKRTDTLCSETVSLDAVVYDVFQELDLEDYDYVVTMQPNAPALRVETLDHALEQCIDRAYDTLISVVNRPRFCWKRENGQVIPLWNQRMNRHCLPPFYVETGAFLITKSRCIKPDSRIGGYVELFELDSGESVDVDTFGDLKLVENILHQKRFAFYVNGNNELGLGHISRVMQIADELFGKPDIYFDEERTEASVFGATTHNLIPVKGAKDFVLAAGKQSYDMIINDILSTSEEYMCSLRRSAPCAKIVNFEDEGDGARYADQVINALYEESVDKNVRAGSQYYIVPKLFLLYEPILIRSKVKNVIVTFGGADPKDYTNRLIGIAQRAEFKNVHFYFVLGKAKRNVERLLSFNRCANFDVLHNIDNMPEVMSRCDVAVTSRGRTCFELAVLGIPTISIAQNRREEKHSFVCEENGFRYLGCDPEENVIASELLRYINMSKGEREGIQQKMLSQNLRRGRENVVSLINEFL